MGKSVNITALNEICETLPNVVLKQCMNTSLISAVFFDIACRNKLFENDIDFSIEHSANIKNAALYYNIGKAKISTGFMNADHLENDEQIRLYKKHVEYGIEILDSVTTENNYDYDYDNSNSYKILSSAIEEHHEKYDGTGFPNQKKGEQISPIGRIVAISNYISKEMTINNKSLEEIESEISKQSGLLFDPKLIGMFPFVKEIILSDNENYGIALDEKKNKKKEVRALELLFQPIFDTRVERATSYEALMRVNDRYSGVILPEQFIPIAEKSNQICELGKWAVEEACEAIIRLQSEGISFKYISVNISGKQLIKKGFVGVMKKIIDKSGVMPEKICFEITEKVLMNHKQELIDILSEVREYGISITLDNFGVEYSTLSRLDVLPIDHLKIDKSFIDKLVTSKKTREIVKTIIDLAKRLKIEVICVGVETKEQADVLQELGCCMIQGYLYGIPKSETDMVS